MAVDLMGYKLFSQPMNHRVKQMLNKEVCVPCSNHSSLSLTANCSHDFCITEYVDLSVCMLDVQLS